MCGSTSEATDHVEPHLGRKDVFQRMGNHIALCHRCHNTVTGKFDYKSAAKPEQVADKIKWMNMERARNEVLQDRSFPKPKALRYEK